MKKLKLNRKVIEYMRQNHMAEEGEGILAAVSGGADSVCLLLVLKDAAELLGIRLAAFHLNHGLRGEEADRDEAYVRRLCEAFEIPLKVVHENVREYAVRNGCSEEEAGRELRYRHLEEAAQEFDCSRIAVAHHMDDDVETVLMNLFRGSGLKGLGGIPSVRGKVIRPLMETSRQEIEEYLNEQAVNWCEDSTNEELIYGRNKIRNVLVPWLEEHVNRRVREHVLKTAEFAAQADEYFRVQADMILKEGTVIPGETAEIGTDVFDAQPMILRTYLVRTMIARTCGREKDISSRHIDAVCGLTGPGGGTEIDLPYGLKAVRGYDRLRIMTAGREEQAAVPMDISTEMNVFPWKKGMEIPKNQYTKWFDYDKIKGALSVRTRQTGDFITIGNGKQKKLNRFFIDEKIPEALRDTIPLLADGNHILWIVGYRTSEEYKITSDTQNVLEVWMNKGE